MSNYNDFDLDIRREPNEPNANASPAAYTANIWQCATDLASLVGASLQYCPTTSDCTITEGDCTNESCSDCHSYCGAACRR